MHEGGAGHPATDRIRVLGITATGYHGVFEHERHDGQTFVADVTLHVDTRAAAAADRLDLTADYGILAEQVVGVLEGEPADLIETVAERIAAVAMTHHGVVGVDVVLHKPQAPVTVPFSDVTVEIHRHLGNPPVVAAPPVMVMAAAATRSGWPAGPDEAGSSGMLADPALPDLEPPGELDVQTGRHAEVQLATDTPEDLAPTLAGLPPVPGLEPASAATAATERYSRAEAIAAPAPFTPQLQSEPPDRLDRTPDTPVEVVLALGSNLGASHETLRRVVLDLGTVGGVEVTAIAPLARTGAVGGPEQPDYLNTVVLASTTLSPRDLLRAVHLVEDSHGRVREERWGPRTIDIDIITYGSIVASADDLELPHPRAHERAFVLEPWAQVSPDAVLPGLGGGPVARLAGTAPDRGGIRWMALDWWAAPEAGAR